MPRIDIPLQTSSFSKESKDLSLLIDAQASRNTVHLLLEENRYMDAFERTIQSLREIRQFSDFNNTEFQAILVALLFDLSTIHFNLKDYKQSEHELEILFKVLAKLIDKDSERFGKYHLIAMEKSTQILRTRKKTIELLNKQQITTSELFKKVNAGIVEATDKLVDSLRKVAQLNASTGDYRVALKFYAEAIKYSKRRTGKVTRKEIKLTIEMAEIMVRIRTMRPRAARLLNAVLPHAIALETIELEEDILALLEIITIDLSKEPRWKAFINKITSPLKGDSNKKI